MNEPDAPLLDYAVISEPFPLYATTGTDDPATALHIVVSNGGGETVYCREIVFSLPEGNLAQSLVAEDAGDGQAPDWTVQRIEPGTQTLLPPGDYAHFLAKPNKADSPVDVSGIVITLENLKISPLPGTARIEIREVATTNTDKWPDNPAFTKLALTKFPAPKIPAMAVSDFRADEVEVAAGSTVTLKWNGPSTLDYTVSHGGDSHPVGKNHSYSAAIDRDTTFQLSYVTGETTHYQTTTVTVTNPKLTGLTVGGDVTVTNGSTTVEGLTVGKDLTANGNVSAITSGTIFRIRELRGPLSESLNINSTISVMKDNAVNIAGDMTVNGNVSAVTSGTIFRIRDLRGPYGESLGVNSTVEVKSGNDITRAGSSVITDGDSIGLQNNQKSGWLYAPAYDYDGDRGYIFRWKPGNRVGGDSWKVARD
ncbi:hypothetical protein [Streptomyces noursei]|uniref:hypothetical protein n=1 Tax=Streptomyces noursei TaxID=1971 RepID=UPI001677A210|nr:hypothetical protein [Streptomyces noursei]MCZ1012751.1 hypothetical protein [Streptomyces noursei]GGX42325.1 hypothetical protein GCM10010341_75300 [Streptomyces noursei]